MNHKQLIVIWLALALIALMGLFPPRVAHVHALGWGDRVEDARLQYRYPFILTAPVDTSRPGRVIEYRDINWGLLKKQWAVVCLAAFGLLAALRDRPSDDEPGEPGDDDDDDLPGPDEPFVPTERRERAILEPA